jgi:hypothetical protein
LPYHRFLVQAPLASVYKLEVFHGIRDVNLFTEYARFGESFVEYTARWSHKRPTLAILHVARLFTDKHYCRILVTFAENRLARVLIQVAPFAATSGRAQARERAPLWQEVAGRRFLLYLH